VQDPPNMLSSGFLITIEKSAQPKTSGLAGEARLP